MKKESRIKLLASLVSIALGLVFGWYIMFLCDPTNSFKGLGTILGGGLSSGVGDIGQILYVSCPIIMTGLSVGFAFKSNMFNIGASGQFTVGAFAAIYVGVKWTFLPAALHCPVAILAAAVAGGIWGMIPGILKAIFKVNEVISGIMLNYAGMLIVNMLIKKHIYDQSKNGTMYVNENAQLERIIDVADVNTAIIITVICAIIASIILNKTTKGYELKVVGLNNNAGQYAGINDKSIVILAMTVAGIFAGIGGALMYLSDFGAFISVEEVVLDKGFTGISVALIGLSNPVGILFAGLFIGYMTVGGSFLQLYGFTPEVVNIITGIIIYCGAFAVPIKMILTKMSERKERREDEQ